MHHVFKSNINRFCVLFRQFTCSSVVNSHERLLVLGIESTCDDTGAAVVDNQGNVLGDALHSQQQIHLDNGGIIPPIARSLHAKYIEEVVNNALLRANVTLQDLNAIAVAVKPGLPLSLVVGMKYAKKLCLESGKPIIPIHHMEAHALTARMITNIPFPFLVLLISGGHSILSVVRDVDDFLLLGHSVDDGMGEAFDKTARRLKLKNLPEYSTLAGGQAIEYAASGFKFNCLRLILDEEEKYGILGGQVLPNVADICASFQLNITRHIIQRLHRAIIFCEEKELLPPGHQTLVVSGGVAGNSFIRNALTKFCNEIPFKTVFPPPNLCTDNGIMIAWNGMERLMAGIGITHDLDSVDIKAQCSLGEDITCDVIRAEIKVPRMRVDIT